MFKTDGWSWIEWLYWHYYIGLTVWKVNELFIFIYTFVLHKHQGINVISFFSASPRRSTGVKSPRPRSDGDPMRMQGAGMMQGATSSPAIAGQ